MKGQMNIRIITRKNEYEINIQMNEYINEYVKKH